MRKNYGETAANWWAEKIEEYNFGVEPNILDAFRKVLSMKIDNAVSKYAHIELSSYKPGQYKKNFEILDNIANSVGLNANIPNGYEMSIAYDTGICDYDDSGMLIPLN